MIVEVCLVKQGMQAQNITGYLGSDKTNLGITNNQGDMIPKWSAVVEYRIRFIQEM